jgi:hypothetical protein
MNKKALSPLVATLLLVVSALVLGAVTMTWGKAYVEVEEEIEVESEVESAVIISIKDIDDPLKDLQIDYITNRITKEEYLEQEKELLTG